MRSSIDRRRFGPWAVVTGASSGIGAAFARHLAAAGINPVLAARRLPQPRALGDELAASHGVHVTVLLPGPTDTPALAGMEIDPAAMPLRPMIGKRFAAGAAAASGARS